MYTFLNKKLQKAQLSIQHVQKYLKRTQKKSKNKVIGHRYNDSNKRGDCERLCFDLQPNNP